MHGGDLRYAEPSQLAIAVAKFSFSINRKGILSGIGSLFNKSVFQVKHKILGKTQIFSEMLKIEQIWQKNIFGI